MAEKTVRFQEMTGNEQLRRKLEHCITAGTLAHAYVLEGQPGSGRRLMVRLVAMALSCEETGDAVPCMRCASCRRIAGGESPDVTQITCPPGRKSIGIDVIRQLRDDVYIRPNDSDYKIYIIHPAQAMTEEAQNAFLKVLEEPPAGVLFFLLCEERSTLLPTVLSRIQVLKTERLTDAALAAYLATASPGAVAMKAENPEQYHRLLRLADGSIGRALQYFDATAEALAHDSRYLSYMIAMQVFAVLSPLPPTQIPAPEAKRVALMQLFGAKIRTLDMAKAVIAALCRGFGELARCKKATDIFQDFFITADEAHQYAQRLSVRQCIFITTELTDLLIDGEANPNVSLYLTTLCRILTESAERSTRI